jgi:DNA-binding NarL/FixJ family response regulator/signal transduction histidine kinase
VASVLGMAAGFDLFVNHLWRPPWPPFFMILACLGATGLAYGPRANDSHASYERWLNWAGPALDAVLAASALALVALSFTELPPDGRTAGRAAILASLGLALTLLYRLSIRPRLPWVEAASPARWWAMALGGGALIGALEAFAPITALLQVPLVAVLCASSVSASSFRRLNCGVGCALALLGTGVVISRGIVDALLCEGAGVAFTVLTSHWMHSSWRWTAERRHLLTQLELAQEQLAAAASDAGALVERERMARDIHDTIAQSLVGIIMTAERLRARQLSGPKRFSPPSGAVPPEPSGAEGSAQGGGPLSRLDRGVRDARLEADLAVVMDLAQDALAEARALVAESSRLDVEGPLDQALTGLGRRFARETGIAVETSTAVPDDLPAPLRMLAARTVQEGLANVRKHAHASHARVSVRAAPGVFRIEVVDDGVGPGAANDADGGFGLTGLRDRVDVLGGTVVLTQRPDGPGSVLRVTVDRVPPASESPSTAPEPPPIAVVVVDDHPIVRRGLVELLGDNSDIDIVGEAATGEEAVRVAMETAADVVLMDLAMPGRGGVWAISQILADSAHAGRATQVLAVTVFESDARIVDAMRAGAAEYIIKASPPEVFAQAVRRAATGNPAPTDQVRAALAHHQNVLSNREREVLRLVAQGLSNIEIAEQLWVQPSTIKTLLTRIYVKLDVPDRAAAVAEALSRDLI